MITQATTAPTRTKVGQVVEVELLSRSYRRDGSVVPWAMPVSTATGILTPTRGSATPCPSASTCTFFIARTPGVATLTVAGPSGIVCDARGTRCVGVSAVVRRFAVIVQA